MVPGDERAEKVDPRLRLHSMQPTYTQFPEIGHLLRVRGQDTIVPSEVYHCMLYEVLQSGFIFALSIELLYKY